MTDSPETAPVSRRQALSDEERRATALHFAAQTVQSNQCSDTVTGQIIKRAKAFEAYLKTGG